MESPSQRLTPLPAPFGKGAFPLRGAEGFRYRKSVGRDDLGAPFSGGEGDSINRISSKQETPSVTACGGDSSLKEGAFPGVGILFTGNL